MDSKMETDNNIGHHSVEGRDQDEQPQEKKSVMTKVKERAKKIKDTIKKHGQGHDSNQVPDNHDLDEEGGENDDVVEEPEVHGAPMKESPVITSPVIGQVENAGQDTVNLGKSTATREDPLTPKDRTEAISTGKYETSATESDPTKSYVSGQDENIEQPRVDFGKTAVMGAPQSHDTHASRVTDPTRTLVHGQEVNLERPRGLEEDLHVPKDSPGAFTSSNDQTKVTDPTGRGGKEAGITPILHSLEKMNIDDEPESKSKPEQKQNISTGSQTQFPYSSTGSHDQFSPEPIPVKTTTLPENPQPPQESPGAVTTPKHEDLSHGTENRKPEQNQSTYTEKILFATSVVADKAITAKNVVVSKLGYGEKDKDNTAAKHEMNDGGDTAKSGSAVDYGNKIAATETEKPTPPAYEKVAGAGSTVTSKEHGTGTGDNNAESGVKSLNKGVSVKDYIAEKLRPGVEDRALSEVISESLHKREEPEKAKSERPARPMGKVTESEEVARRLGIEDHDKGESVQSSNANSRLGTEDDDKGESVQSSKVNSQGSTVVEKLKGAVSSWLGSKDEVSQGSKDEVSQTSPQSLGTSHGNEGFSSPANKEAGHEGDIGARRLEESGK